MDGQAAREPAEDELVLAIWDGDENAKAQLIVRYVPSLERVITGRYRRLHSGEVEDVVAEAIRRFWQARRSFDPSKTHLSVCLYRIAKQVAAEYTGGRLKWQKARLLEQHDDDAVTAAVAVEPQDVVEDQLDTLERQKSPVVKMFAEEFAKLSPVERDVWQAFADAGDVLLDAAQLGIEMGVKYQGGVPYTGVNIRQVKFRAKQKLIRALKLRGIDLVQLGYANE